MALDDQVLKNVNFLKGSLLNDEQHGKLSSSMTIGRHYDVPGMWQSHHVLSVDIDTGVIFWPKDISRKVSIAHAHYEQEERGAVTLDYCYAVQHPMREQVVGIPPGYRVFPLEFIISRDRLSAQARAILEKTETELFIPAVAYVDMARRSGMDVGTFFKILKYEMQYGKSG